MTVQRTSHSEAETLRLAARLARALSAGDVLCLEGPLGAGKTCFVRGLATGLGLDPAEVSSPTFVIWRRYEDHAPLALVHVDAFRLEGPDDLDSVGWDELLEAPDTVIAVEWPSRIAAALPARRITVELGHVGETTRRIALDAPPEIASTWENADEEPAPDRTPEPKPGAAAEPKPCPSCGKTVAPDTESYPFCSERCRLVDLGKWMDERYRIAQRDPDIDIEE